MFDPNGYNGEIVDSGINDAGEQVNIVENNGWYQGEIIGDDGSATWAVPSQDFGDACDNAYGSV